MERKSIMIDMDEVIVKGRFTEFLDEFLGGVDFEKLNGFFDLDVKVEGDLQVDAHHTVEDTGIVLVQAKMIYVNLQEDT